MARLGFLLAALLAAAPALAGDLVIGWIGRTPRLDYVRGAADPTREGWPAAGSTVSWDAHLVRFEGADLPDVGYRWLLDGVEAARGSVAIPAGARVTVSLPWTWTFERHTLTFELDTGQRLSVFTDALSVGFYVEQGFYDLFRAKQHLLAGAHSVSFEDWAQRQIRRLNEMAAAAIYPETPAGVHDRFRIDEIVLVPDGALPLVPLSDAGRIGNQPNGATEPNTGDRSVDLIWGFPSSEAQYYTDFTTTSETNPFFLNGTLLHELGHARGLVDVYGWQVRSGVEGDRIDITENGARVFGSSFMPSSGPFAHFSSVPGLMNQSYGFLDRHSAAALQQWAGRRATKENFNEPSTDDTYLNDLPNQNALTIRFADGAPAANADVWIYRATGTPGFYFSKVFDDVPDLKLKTDGNGRVLVGRCPFSADGRIVHRYGFSNATAIVRVASGSKVTYDFLESLGFNLAYWRGEREVAEHELVVGVGPVCFRNAAVLAGPLPGSFAVSPVVLAWGSVPGATSYDVWATEGGGAPRLLATTASTSLTASLTGAIRWWVEARLPAPCAAIRSGISFFDVGAAPPGTASASFFVPVVLAIHGAAGSYYTSELVLTNRGSTDARVTFRYAGGDAAASDAIGAGKQLVIPDAIASLRARGLVGAGADALGTLRVVFEGISGPDAAAVTLRTTTPVTGGRAGLAYRGVPWDELLRGASAVVGLRNDAADRANLAVQNAGFAADGSITLRATAVESGGGETRLFERTLAPGEFFQASNALSSLPVGASAWIRIEKTSGSAPYFAYGVLNDAVTSDGSLIAATPIDAGPVAEWTLPVAVETPVFTTELVVANLSPLARTVRATLGNETAAFDLALAPFEQRLVPQLVDALRAAGATLPPRGATVVGALFLADTSGDSGALLAAARVSSPGAGGRLGLFETAVPTGAAAAAGVWLDALRQDGENRTNVAFVNAGASGAETFDVDVFDGDTGRLATTVSGVAALDARGFAQIDGLLGRFAPGVTHGYALVRRASGSGPFLSYAVINDGASPGERSGDGAFLLGR